VVAVMTGALSLAAAATAAAVSVGVAALCGWRFHVRAGGVTGDFLGATQQVGECALLLSLALVQWQPW
jgi:adenosylcobinamide-GDP ribazoletransferase